MNVLTINDETIDAAGFIKQLKLEDRFNALLEELAADKITVHAAKRIGIEATAEELQERVNTFRRLEGLHRAADTFAYFESMGVTADDFERYIGEEIIQEKMHAQITNKEAVEAYFRLHSPKFDRIEISHIVVETENKARELMAIAEDEPDEFPQLAFEHSVAGDTKYEGGSIGELTREQLPNALEAKLFNAEPGDLLGPLPVADGVCFEIYRVDKKQNAEMDDATVAKIEKILFDEWVAARMEENRIEIG